MRKPMRKGVVTLLLVTGLVVAKEGEGRSHPQFDDGGVMPWYTDLAAAQKAARSESKLVFIEYGREL